jgi:hypothetical protein
MSEKHLNDADQSTSQAPRYRSDSQPRDGWEEAFADMRHRGDDKLLDGKFVESSEWDRLEWTW